MRYEDVPKRVYDVLDFVREGWFPDLRGAKILLVFDNQQARNKGKVVLASIRKASDLQKYLTVEGKSKSITGYDYILTLDKVAWRRAGKENRIRIIRHELRHTEIRMSSTNPWGLRGHSIEDFYSEIKLNKHDPRWAQKLVGITEAVYSAKRKEANIRKKAGMDVS